MRSAARFRRSTSTARQRVSNYFSVRTETRRTHDARSLRGTSSRTLPIHESAITTAATAVYRRTTPSAESCPSAAAV